MKKRNFSLEEIDTLSLEETEIYQKFIKIEKSKEVELADFQVNSLLAPHNKKAKKFIEAGQKAKENYLKPLSKHFDLEFKPSPNNKKFYQTLKKHGFSFGRVATREEYFNHLKSKKDKFQWLNDQQEQ